MARHTIARLLPCVILMAGMSEASAADPQACGGAVVKLNTTGDINFYATASGPSLGTMQSSQIAVGTKVLECSPNNRIRLQIANQARWIDAFNVTTGGPASITPPAVKEGPIGIQRAYRDGFTLPNTTVEVGKR
jgi:hypothetical protein